MKKVYILKFIDYNNNEDVYLFETLNINNIIAIYDNLETAKKADYLWMLENSLNATKDHDGNIYILDDDEENEILLQDIDLCEVSHNFQYSFIEEHEVKQK